MSGGNSVSPPFRPNKVPFNKIEKGKGRRGKGEGGRGKGDSID